MNAQCMTWNVTFMLLRSFVIFFTLRPFDLNTALTYLLMDNFCPCFSFYFIRTFYEDYFCFSPQKIRYTICDCLTFNWGVKKVRPREPESFYLVKNFIFHYEIHYKFITFQISIYLKYCSLSPLTFLLLFAKLSLTYKSDNVWQLLSCSYSLPKR